MTLIFISTHTYYNIQLNQNVLNRRQYLIYRRHKHLKYISQPLRIWIVQTISVTIFHQYYNQIQEPVIDKDEIFSEAYLDPSIDRIPSEYTIDNQPKLTEPFQLIPTLPIISSHPDTAYHQYSQVTTICCPANITPPTTSNSKPLVSPSDRVNSTLPSNISLNLDVLPKTVGFQNLQKVIKYYK